MVDRSPLLNNLVQMGQAQYNNAHMMGGKLGSDHQNGGIED